MSFPFDPLTVLAEVALNADLTADPATWAFTDATNIIYTRDPISITRGRPDQASVADSSTCSMTGDNRLGHWSTRNPSGAWYGQLRKGTPVRISAEGHVRFTGFFSELPPRWDVSGYDRYAPMTARGLLSRLGRGASPARSAIRRTTLGSGPSAYWHLEDGGDATQAGSGLSGGTTLDVLGTVYFGSGNTLAVGSAGAADFTDGGRLQGSTGLAGAAVADWEAEVCFGVDVLPTSVPGANIRRVISWRTPGAITEWGVVIEGVGAPVWHIGGFWSTASSSTNFFSFLTVVMEAGRTYNVRLKIAQSGADIDARIYVDGSWEGAETIPSTTVYEPTSVSLNDPADAPNPAANLNSVSHAGVWSPARSTVPDMAAAVIGYLDEEAHTRFLRLCDEEGILATCAASTSQPMGIQGIKSALELFRECEATDQGYLYEGLDFGLVFQGHTERENLAAALELDYTAPGHVAPPLEPTDDDQAARNDVEVKRDGGSSSRLVEESTDVELSIPNIGRRDDSKTYSLGTDDQTYQLAGWRLHVGTFPGYRYPTVTLNLAAGPSLIDDVCDADLAFLTTIDNPPDDIGPGLVGVIVEGYTETLAQFGWDLAANCSLNAPNVVGVLAQTSGDTDPLLGWLDWDSCELDTTVNTTATTWLINASPVDTTAADDFPRDVMVEGELVTVTACSGASAPQTWTVTRSVNGVVKAHSAGVTIALAYPFILAL